MPESQPEFEEQPKTKVEQTINAYIEKTGVKWQVDISRPCAKPTDNKIPYNLTK